MNSYWGLVLILLNVTKLCVGLTLNLSVMTDCGKESPVNLIARSLMTQSEELLASLMKPENTMRAFNITKDDLKKVPKYDDDLQEYVEPKRAMDSNVQFVLYTSAQPLDERQIYIGETDQLLRRGFQRNVTTKIICHGFMSDYIEGPGSLLNPAYFESSGNEPLNIILINWANMAGIHKTVPKTKQWTDIFYFPPAQNTEIVGNLTALLIKFLVQEANTPLSKIHLIGHSLGAHAMGYAGRNLNFEGKVSRITALDPASPCFESHRILCFRGNYVSVSKNDAVFVDVIHTHARALGMRIPVGQVDFYPNGGFSQPGCAWNSFGICSHRRSIELMAESIKHPPFEFLARKCSSWDSFIGGSCHATEFALLGEHCSTRSEGVFFLATTERENETLSPASII